jgi:NitT/TauT family transport system substrate-binding protein
MASLSFAFLAACSRGERIPEPPSEKITISYATIKDAALAQIALQKEYFQAHGLDASTLLQPYGKLALQDVIDGKADFATVAETPFVLATMNGHNLTIVATVHSSRDHSIVARNDRGISVPADLVGKKIATTLGTSAHYYLDGFLTVNGIERNQITIIDTPAEESSSILTSGRVDAVAAFATYAQESISAMSRGAVVFHDPNIYTSTFNIVASQEFVRTHPQAVQKLLRALIQAEQFAASNPVEAQRIVAHFCNKDIGGVQAAWGDARFQVTLDQSLLLALEDESRWAMAQHLTSAKETPNYLNHIYLEGLAAIRPSMVRILK